MGLRTNNIRRKVIKKKAISSKRDKNNFIDETFGAFAGEEDLYKAYQEQGLLKKTKKKKAGK